MEKDEVFFLGMLSFIIGVASGSFFVFPIDVLLFCAGAVSIAVFAVFPKREVIYSALIVLLWFGGATLSVRALHAFQNLADFSDAVQGEVRVVTDPEEREFFQQVAVRFEQCASERCPVADVLWQAPLASKIAAGDLLDFSCQLEIPKNFTPDFDYRMYLAKDGIGYLCRKAESVSMVSGDWQGKLRSWLYVPKHVLEGALSRALSEPEAGLAKGLLLGGDTYLPKALKDSFTSVGLTHIIAVSGYNITLIAETLLIVGLGLGLWRRQAIWGALFGIIFFIFMIGLPASALRAGTMAGVVFIAWQTGRLARPINALLLAGGGMLLFHPLLLRYDLGFQLSFLATLALLWISPYYEYFAPEGWVAKKIGEVLIMTVAVLLFVLPVTLFNFHFFSPLILVSNILVILVPFAMATSFGAAILFLVVPGAHLFVAWVAFGLLTTITRSVEFLGAFEGVRMTVAGFGLVHLCFWYSLLILVVLAGRYWFAKKLYIYG